MTHVSVFGFLCLWIFILGWFGGLFFLFFFPHWRWTQEKLSNSSTQQHAYHYTSNDYRASLYCFLRSVGLMEGSKSAEKRSQRILLALSKKGLSCALGVMHLAMGAVFLVGRKQRESTVILHWGFVCWWNSGRVMGFFFLASPEWNGNGHCASLGRSSQGVCFLK